VYASVFACVRYIQVCVYAHVDYLILLCACVRAQGHVRQMNLGVRACTIKVEVHVLIQLPEFSWASALYHKEEHQYTPMNTVWLL